MLLLGEREVVTSVAINVVLKGEDPASCDQKCGGSAIVSALLAFVDIRNPDIFFFYGCSCYSCARCSKAVVAEHRELVI